MHRSSSVPRRPQESAEYFKRTFYLSITSSKIFSQIFYTLKISRRPIYKGPLDGILYIQKMSTRRPQKKEEDLIEDPLQKKVSCKQKNQRFFNHTTSYGRFLSIKNPRRVCPLSKISKSLQSIDDLMRVFYPQKTSIWSSVNRRAQESVLST